MRQRRCWLECHKCTDRLRVSFVVRVNESRTRAAAVVQAALTLLLLMLLLLRQRCGE